jgi:hypothetical protein
MHPARLLFVGGILHFGILFASALVPRVLDWRSALRQLDPLSRQLVWVHGLFIVLVIIAFGVLSVAFPHELADGSRLARAVCAFIGLFWTCRLVVQFAVFDARPYLKSALLAIGYRGLTVVFCYLAIVYAWAAFSRF